MNYESAPIYDAKTGHTSVSTDLDWILREAVRLSSAHNNARVDIRQLGKFDGRYFGVLLEPTAEWTRWKSRIVGDDDASESVAIVTASGVVEEIVAMLLDDPE